MTILWFFIGVAIIFGISRYNESNKLFWQLLLAMLFGFATVKMVKTCSKSSEDGKNLAQVCSTQVSAKSNSSIDFVFGDALVETTAVTELTPVSKIYTPGLREINVILEGIFGRTRDQPLREHPYNRKILRSCTYINTS